MSLASNPLRKDSETRVCLDSLPADRILVDRYQAAIAQGVACAVPAVHALPFSTSSGADEAMQLVSIDPLPLRARQLLFPDLLSCDWSAKTSAVRRWRA